jgi:membrane associated rhomboid family serine protease
MLFFPYKADVDLGRWPVVTLAVCGLCLWVFGQQVISEHQYRTALRDFCARQVGTDQQLVLRHLPNQQDKHYCALLLELRDVPDRKSALTNLAESSLPLPFYRNRADGVDYVYGVLADSLSSLDRTVPHSLTERLQYNPNELNIMRMLSAAFTHGDWWHVLFNLVFFFAFAASVEIIAGYFYYVGFFALAAIGTHLAYSYSVRNVPNALPTVGLSGVVMAMMAFLATIMPSLSIRCLFWLLLWVRVFRVPAMLLAVFYVAQDLLSYVNRDADEQVNYIAHMSGAAIGIGFGLWYRLRHSGYLRQIAVGI